MLTIKKDVIQHIILRYYMKKNDYIRLLKLKYLIMTNKKKELNEAEKLKELTEIEGYDHTEDMLIDFATASLIPGICMNPKCTSTYLYEPDNDSGWCDDCQTNTVKSAFILAGII